MRNMRPMAKILVHYNLEVEGDAAELRVQPQPTFRKHHQNYNFTI
jgi:hypothetical protein